MRKICVLPGEGIGPEVTEQAVKVLKALPIDFEFVYGDIGYETYEKTGEALPKETIEKVSQADATLFGAVTTPPNIPNYVSPILRLRQLFDLYVNLRPCRSIPNENSRENIDITVFRENTEGLYSGSEKIEDEGNTAITERIITRKGSERIIRAAFQYAQENGKEKVTVVHKANVLRESDGLFLRVAHEINEEFPDIEMEEYIVDACAMALIRNPENFQVIVTTNMFGDILSDEVSMLTGGLGVAASGNIGNNRGVFEPVHGSAPDIAEKGIANPVAMILSLKLMLDFLGDRKHADNIEEAVMRSIEKGNVTEDLGGNLKTCEVTEKIIGELM